MLAGIAIGMGICLVPCLIYGIHRFLRWRRDMLQT